MSQNSEFFSSNIEDDTLLNDNYRKVIFTANNIQLVLMSIKPGDDIGLEIHERTDQFIRIESGKGLAILNDNPIKLSDGMALLIPAGTKHNVINTCQKYDLKLYTLYSPPEHPSNDLEKTKEI